MREQTLELRYLLLSEADGREAQASELADVAAQQLDPMFGSALRRQVHHHRIRALELRGQASALAEQYEGPDRTDG